MTDSFDAEERPTRPAVAAKSKTSRWKAVANAALERGFGRLSDGDFDQGNLPADSPAAGESGVHVVAATSDVEPVPDAAAAPTAPREERRERGPRGTVRMPTPGPRGPTGTMRIAPPKNSPRAVPARRPWPTIAAFGLLSVALLGEIVFVNGPPASVEPAVGRAADPPPPVLVGPADPTEPPPDFEPVFAGIAATPGPASPAATANSPTPKHAKPRRRAPAYNARGHSGSSVF